MKNDNLITLIFSIIVIIIFSIVIYLAFDFDKHPSYEPKTDIRYIDIVKDNNHENC
jgi:uncharacterized membrane protein